MRRSLEGVKVVELTTYVAAPMCGRMLADFGAEVIKVESAGGDSWRYIGMKPDLPVNEYENPQFDVFNAGKKSIALNLKTPEGMKLMMQLLEDADIFLTNTRPKSLKKLGLDYDTLKEKFPRLIYSVITGFGEVGPEAENPGFDNVAFWTKTGFILDMNTSPDNPYPVDTPAGVGDSITGNMLMSGILMALYNREKTGEGDYVTTSLYGTGIWTMAAMVIKTQKKYGETYPKSRAEARPMNQNYKCKDGGWLRIAILDFAKDVAKFLKLLGCNDMVDNPKYQSIADFTKDSENVLKRFGDAFMTKDADEWIQILSDNDIVCDRLTHFADVSESEQAWANNYVEKYVNHNGEECVMPVNAIRIKSQPIPHSESAPLLAEHTASIMSSLGYSDAEIAEYAAKGAVKVRN